MAEPNAAAAQVGPGTLYWAPLGTAEPTAPTATLDAAWLQIGFTETGSQFVVNRTVTDLLVAEQLDPIKVVTTARSITAEFNLAEMTAKHLQMVMNGGTLATSGSYTTFTPAATGAETRAMLLWISDDTQEMWLFRQVIQVGTITRQNRKGALATFTAQFRAEIPASNAAPFESWFLTSVRA
jgi:hypothetical protein